MAKKAKSTHDELVASLTSAQKKEYDKGYQGFLRSELTLAIAKKDEDRTSAVS